MICALVALAPLVALAGNGTHPRTPVKWEPRPACLTIVDRTQSSVLEFGYSIPYEDLRPEDAVDEVDNSRQHQFVAFCRPHSVQLPLPVWLSQADVDIAAEKMLVDPADLKPEDVIETSAEWSDCFVRITGDDERRLITFAETMKPVVWDTTGLPAGPYVINGYTWEPAFNIYSLRPGVVKVVDDPDPAASPPVLAISNQLGEEIVYETEELRLFGCASAMDGATITGYWAQTDNDGGPLEWHSFAEDTPIAGEDWELMFAPPPETVKKLIALRVDIKDPMDRVYTAHMDLLASVLEGSPSMTGGDCDGSGFIAEPGCGGSSSEESGEPGSSGGTADGTGGAGSGGPTDGGSSGGAGEGSTGAMQTPGEGEGCAGCAVGAVGAAPWWLVVLALGRRRRR